MSIDVAAKWRFVDERNEKHNEAKAARKKWRKCFWTRPRGHKFVFFRGEHFLTNRWECVGCGKRKYL